MTRFNADQIRKACRRPERVMTGLYEARNGTRYIGLLVSAVPTALRDSGYKRVGRIDEFDLRDAGVLTIEAQYIGGAQPTGKFVRIVVLEERR